MNLALHFLFLLASGSAFPVSEHEQTVTLVKGQAFPLASKEHGIENPVDATFDNQGRLYVLDVGAKCVFAWQADGTFFKRIGGKGEGPGEFSFTDPARSKITFDGTYVIVMDDGVGKFHYFKDGDYAFLVKKPARIGRIVHYEALANQTYLMWIQEYRNQEPFSLVKLANRDFSVKKVLLEFPDNMFRMNEQGGWDYYAFSKRPVVYGDYFSAHILLGHTHSSDFSVYDLEGNRIKVISTQIPRQEVSDLDKKTIKNLYPWLKPPNRVIFPEFRGTYNVLLPLFDQVTLISHYDPTFGIYRGTVCHNDGACLDGMTMNFGERGGLVAGKSTILGFFNDENGDFRITTLIPSLAGKF